MVEGYLCPIFIFHIPSLNLQRRLERVPSRRDRSRPRTRPQIAPIQLIFQQDLPNRFHADRQFQPVSDPARGAIWSIQLADENARFLIRLDFTKVPASAIEQPVRAMIQKSSYIVVNRPDAHAEHSGRFPIVEPPIDHPRNNIFDDSSAPIHNKNC